MEEVESEKEVDYTRKKILECGLRGERKSFGLWGIAGEEAAFLERIERK